LVSLPEEKGGGYILIDTGYDRDYPLFRRRLSDKDIALEDIKAVFLTHHHDDHAGFLTYLKRDAGDPPVIMSRSTAALLTGGVNDTTRGGFWVSRRIAFLARLKAGLDRKWTLSFPPYAASAEDIVFDTPSEGADALAAMGIDAKVIPTPGHCVDHHVLVLANGYCLAGDAAAAMLLWAGSRHFPVFMTDLDEAYRDWQAILDSGAATIIPTHGKAFPASILRKEMGKLKGKDLPPFTSLR
jgi:glyoxylase-like metal-dependent hydrolase (beta-lactamase superfamily II)